MNRTNLEDSSSFQRPSYSTDGIYQDHQDLIKLILVDFESSQNVYHIKTVDDSFVCCSWIITLVREEVKKTYDLDYGMKIGGSITMRRTNTSNLLIPNRYA